MGTGTFAAGMHRRASQEVLVRITTWDELRAMTPEQRREHFDRSVVLDPAHDPDPVIRRHYEDAVAWATENLPRRDGA